MRKIFIIIEAILLLVCIHLTNIDNKKMTIENKEVSYSYKMPIEELEPPHTEFKTISRGGVIEEETFELTFYTSLDDENGGYAGITCTGVKLRPGMVANNKLPLGTIIMTKEYGELTVSDRGGSNFNNEHRLDIFVPIMNGENNSQYKKRVVKMGRVKVKGYILK